MTVIFNLLRICRLRLPQVLRQAPGPPPSYGLVAAPSRPVFMLLLGLLVTLVPDAARADVIHPAYLRVREIESGRFEVLWKVPLRYNMRLPIHPIFPEHCKRVGEPAVEPMPSALVERWHLDCGNEGLDGHTIEIAGLKVTIMDVFVRVELLDGRIYEDQLRASSPRFEVSERQPFPTIVSNHLMFGLEHTVRQIPIMLLVFALALATGAGPGLMPGITAFALGYAGAFIANAFGWIGVAQDWGAAACAIAAFGLIMISITRSKTKRYRLANALVYLLLGALLGAALGSDWSRSGLAYGDIPVAGIALFLGVWIGLVLLAGVPVLIHLLHNDFNANRLPPLALLPAYVLGGVSVFLILSSGLSLASAGAVQPYLRPESMVVALAAGLLIGRSTGKGAQVGPTMPGTVFLLAAVVGLYAGSLGVNLPAGSAAIPLSLATFGLLLLLSRSHPALPGLPVVAFAGVFHGWINGRWLAEHVSASLPSAVGGMMLLTCIMLSGALLRRHLKPAKAVTMDVAAGLVLVAGSFAMRFAGYRVSAFKEISVGGAAGLKVPLLSLVLLVLVLIMVSLAFRRGRSGLSSPRFSMPASLLLLIALIAIPYGTYALSTQAASAAALSDEEAGELIAGLLSNTYRAVNLKGEEEIYDRLSISVYGDLVEQLYLESRKRSVIPSQADAEAKLIDVTVTEIMDRGPAPDGIGYSFTTGWQVAGTIRHWAHKHNRLNRYSGVLTIRAVDDVWKMYELELLDEARL